MKQYLPQIFLTLSIIFWAFSILRSNYKHRKMTTLLLQEVNELNKKVAIFKQLLDLVGSGICNPAVKNIYLRMRSLSFEEYPKTSKDFAEMLKKINDENYKRVYSFFLAQIENADDIEEKTFFQHKLEKLQEIKNLYDAFDEDSSQEYKQMVMQELHKTISEFNEEDGI